MNWRVARARDACGLSGCDVSVASSAAQASSRPGTAQRPLSATAKCRRHRYASRAARRTTAPASVAKKRGQTSFRRRASPPRAVPPPPHRSSRVAAAAMADFEDDPMAAPPDDDDDDADDAMGEEGVDVRSGNAPVGWPRALRRSSRRRCQQSNAAKIVENGLGLAERGRRRRSTSSRRRSRRRARPRRRARTPSA